MHAGKGAHGVLKWSVDSWKCVLKGSQFVNQNFSLYKSQVKNKQIYLIMAFFAVLIYLVLITNIFKGNKIFLICIFLS